MVSTPRNNIYNDVNNSWMTVNICIAIWFFSYCVKFFHSNPRYTAYNNLPEEKARNVITYVAQFIVTTLIFAGQVHGAYGILFQMEDHVSEDRLKILNASLVTMSVLYVWELVYRVNIGTPLLIHHIMTIILCQLILATYFDYHTVIYLRLACVVAFSATTEQMTFVALYLYRLELYSGIHTKLFQISAALSFILKTTSIFWCIYLWAKYIHEGRLVGKWGTFWTYATLPSMLILWLTQMYATFILIKLSKRCDSRDQKNAKIGEGGKGGHMISELTINMDDTLEEKDATCTLSNFNQRKKVLEV